MNSHNLSLRYAVCAALALTSATALAYIPTSNTDADTVVYWGGATASSLSAQELAVAAVCDTDTHLLYVKETSAPNIDRPGNDWAVACKTAVAGATKTGLPNGKKVLVIKRDRGGSGVGVGPVQTKNTDANNGAISFLNVSPAVCNLAVTPGVNGAPQIQLPGGAPGTFVPAIGCAATYNVNALTEMGTSDIEADKFFGINTPIVDGVGLPYRTEGDRAFTSQNALAALVFNNPVTLALYRKLQEAQFAAANVCNPANAAFNDLTVSGSDRPDTTNAESAPCMPSLTREEIDSVLTGRIVSWTQLLRSDGTAIPGLTGSVQICRRVDGSGTQATINALVSSFPCDTNLTDTSIDIITPRVPNGTTVIGNSGSKDVDNCLHNFNATANPFAIGNLSIEGRNTDKLRNWRFIKVDGVAPTLQNVHDGDYWLWSQQSCQLRGTGLPYNSPVGADDTPANKRQVYNALCGGNATNGLNSLATLTKLNNETDPVGCANGSNLAGCQSNYTFGRSGWLATPTTALLYDNVLAATTRPINAYTREFATGRVNICQTPVKATVGGNAARGTIVAPNPSWNP